MFGTMALELYVGYVAGDIFGTIPGMLGAVLGGVTAGAAIAGIGLTGSLAVLGAAALGEALLHKSPDVQTFAFPGQTYPTSFVTGMPSAV
jgi:hypothetical protein